MPDSILITGASSGIGEALALAYAGPGARLALTGRDPTRLAAVARACTMRGAAADHHVIDVVDRAAMQAMRGWYAASGSSDSVDSQKTQGLSAAAVDRLYMHW